MALGMFGCMEQQTAHCGRQLGTAHDARTAQVLFGRLGQLTQSTIDDGLPGTKEVVC